MASPMSFEDFLASRGQQLPTASPPAGPVGIAPARVPASLPTPLLSQVSAPQIPSSEPSISSPLPASEPSSTGLLDVLGMLGQGLAGAAIGFGSPQLAFQLIDQRTKEADREKVNKNIASFYEPLYGKERAQRIASLPHEERIQLVKQLASGNDQVKNLQAFNAYKEAGLIPKGSEKHLSEALKTANVDDFRQLISGIASSAASQAKTAESQRLEKERLGLSKEANVRASEAAAQKQADKAAKDAASAKLSQLANQNLTSDADKIQFQNLLTKDPKTAIQFYNSRLPASVRIKESFQNFVNSFKSAPSSEMVTVRHIASGQTKQYPANAVPPLQPGFEVVK